MLIAFIGSHGTGKTTTATALQKELGKDWSVFDDEYRKLARQLGYTRPRDPILRELNKQITITAMTASTLGAMKEWMQNLDNNGIIDLGSPSLLAYHRYWMKICETPVSPFLLTLCKYISDQIDYYIYLPTGVIPLKSDDMRSDDPIFQKDIDQWVISNLDELQVSGNKIIRIESSGLEERLKEIREMTMIR